ncbi:type III secretion protein [Paraburkholderia caledonica]|uniref:type III secretion protein n=1 Tax=Paraburkholderia caledonica TaxID=134536 RepID=UPI003C980E8D
MKLLRILTGNHAGAEARLSTGAHRVHSDDDADIRITDWSGAAVVLNVDETDVVTVTRTEPAPVNAVAMDSTDSAAAHTDEAAHPDALDPGVVLMTDFVPMQFDQTVLCIGPDDAVWPSDLALLSTLLVKPESADDPAHETAAGSGQWIIKRKLVTAVGAACVMLAIGSGVVSMALSTRAKASLPPPDVAAAEQANRDLAGARLTDLHATLDGHGGVLVTGLVSSAGDDLVAQRLLEHIQGARVTRQYGNAEDTARGIKEAIGMANVDVHYAGKGVFAITGTGVDIDGVQQAVQRVRADLDANVKELRIDATGSDATPTAEADGQYTTVVSSDRVRYAQTPDGVKHIFILADDPADAPMSASDAAANGDSDGERSHGLSGAAPEAATQAGTQATAQAAAQATAQAAMQPPQLAAVPAAGPSVTEKSHVSGN